MDLSKHPRQIIIRLNSLNIKACSVYNNKVHHLMHNFMRIKLLLLLVIVTVKTLTTL